MTTKNVLRDELIDYFMNLSIKYENRAHNAKDVCRWNIHMYVVAQIRNEVYAILIGSDDYIIKTYNEVFNNNKN